MTVWTDGRNACRAASVALRTLGRGENTTDPRRGCDNAPPANPDGASRTAGHRSGPAAGLSLR
ncbi:hypothetical protein C6P96_23175 [Burkholderia multivorans]|nr:hypothetical protein C6P95_01845 [Burkholderia multivorans]PRF08374.1 hypothetical protein C6P96_23175 [Burkholderia multivorans]